MSVLTRQQISTIVKDEFERITNEAHEGYMGCYDRKPENWKAMNESDVREDADFYLDELCTQQEFREGVRAIANLLSTNGS